MARTVTLLALRNRVYRRADLENAVSRYPTSEVTEELNESIASWYVNMISLRGKDYFTKTGTITTASGTSTYTLPTDFFIQVGHPEVLNGSVVMPLQPFLMVERGELKSAPNSTGMPAFYMLRGKQSLIVTSGQAAGVANDIIELLPVPSGIYTVTLYYVPNPEKLVSDNDTIDTIGGWDEWIVVDAARKLCLKEDNQQGAAVLAAERDRIMNQMTGIVTVRDAAAPQRVKDIRGSIRRSWSLRYKA